MAILQISVLLQRTENLPVSVFFFLLFFLDGLWKRRLEVLVTSRDISLQPLMAVSSCGCLEKAENYVPH